MNRYCYNCERMVNANVGVFSETYPVNGEPTTINAHVVVCGVCGSKLWDSELDNQNLIDAFCQYRSIHALLHPEEIKEIRAGKGFNAEDFDKLLGFKGGSIKKFERGTLQTKDQDDIIRGYAQSNQ